MLINWSALEGRKVTPFTYEIDFLHLFDKQNIQQKRLIINKENRHNKTHISQAKCTQFVAVIWINFVTNDDNM